MIDKLEQTAVETAIEAGNLLKTLRRGQVEVKHKGAVDLVTEADLAAQQLIIDSLSAAHPYPVRAEESPDIEIKSDTYWLVDPLDGTTNYAHEFPIYCVAIALMQGGEPSLGVVYDPNLDQLFVARHGSGATRNGISIKVSGTSDLNNSLLATGFPYDIREHSEPTLKIFGAFAVKAQGIRRAGAAALDLCYVACGRIDGFWESGLKPWDTAAAGLIALEAGALASDYSGHVFSHFRPEAVFSNGFIHEQMLGVLASSMQE